MPYQKYDIILRLRGGGNELPKRNLFAPEIYILERLHREGAQAAILRFRPVGAPTALNTRMERARLNELYGPAIVDDVIGKGIGVKFPETYEPPLVEEPEEVDPWAGAEEQSASTADA